MGSLTKSAIEEQAVAVRSSLAMALPQGGKAVVGYSGGADSALLAYLAAEHAPPGVEVSALHVNHGLHELAASWAELCARQCKKWRMRLQVVKISLDPQASGLEARAREGRLKAFRDHDADVVLMAHHADDLAETVMQRAFRGSGARGLDAMRLMSRLPGSGKSLLRPLLAWRKQSLAQASAALGLEVVDDPANADARHNRNWLRHQVLPEAERRYPGAVAALAATAGLAADTADLLDDLAEQDDRSCRQDGFLCQDLLAGLGQARVRNWLAWSLVATGRHPPSGKHLTESARQLCVMSTPLALDFDGMCLSGPPSRLEWVESAGAKLGKIPRTSAP